MKVAIKEDLIDLIPVLMESLKKDLDQIRISIEAGDLEEVSERAHSSRGAALTFGFNDYAEELKDMRIAVVSNDWPAINESYERLNLLLDKVEFHAGR
ncbi:Hpt domain-containing protein [Maridesulfovibrio sp. FT414]|uniref:Hpt domain-containing protein n=1 Tax=Maridesulfovibrio sp. FT414 TaxID=2979469 RepID=UPI003D800A12